ncbi:MAG: exonuclease SbcCD subunit D [Bacteroidota bacterium]
MKLLHTADWHLGKRLDHYSRLSEQRLVMEEICEIAEREQVDAVLLAGDLYDHINPSIEAIELLYKTLKRLADNGKRAVIGIAGNHDSPDRIEAPDPLARECGIILTGYPHSQVPTFKLDTGLEVLQSAPGFVEISLPSANAPLRIILTPYANEVRLRTYLGLDDPEQALREALQQHWQQLAEQYCDPNGVNLLLGHLFCMQKDGPREEEGEDEKPILMVGGAQEIYTHNLPTSLQYAALGHLHRPFAVCKEPYPIVYAGSPLSYSMSEAGQQKSVVLIEAEPGQAVQYQRLPLQQGKRLARQSFDEVDQAEEWLKANPDLLVELTLISDDYLTAADRKRLYQAHQGIINIIPQITNQQLLEGERSEIDLSRNMTELFRDYFASKQGGQKPDDQLMDLFKEVLAEDEE